MPEPREFAPLEKREIITLILVLVAAVAIRGYLVQFQRVISSDGVAYASIARDILAGRGLVGATVFPPFYPLLVALSQLAVGEIELAGRLAALVMGSLLVVPVYLLGRELLDRRAGLVAAVLVTAWPSLRSWSTEVMSQSTYITLVLTGVYLAWRAQRTRSPSFALAGGAVMALAHLTRSEGILVYLAISLVLLVGAVLEREGRERRIVCLAAGWVAFVLTFFPYALFLHNVTGSWQLTGKSRVVLADALMDYLGQPDLKRNPRYQALTYLDVIRNYPDFLWANFSRNLGQIGRELLPLPLWGLALLGFSSGGWSREKALVRGYLLATFAPLTVIVVFFWTGPEYIQAYLPVLFLWVGGGLLWLEGKATRIPWPERLGDFLRSRIGVLSTVVVVTLSAYLFWQQVPANPHLPYHYDQDGGRYDHKLIGLMLNKQLPREAKIMTRWGRIAFYADRGWVDMPQASLGEIVATARRQGARFLVVDGLVAEKRPQLRLLAEPLSNAPEQIFFLGGSYDIRPLPELRLYLLYKDPNSLGVAVYELVK
jgi:4-amino-4-deoxy-L-arabinose transferase-like glycosyltransferase